MKNIFLKYIFVFATVLLVSFVMLTSIISTTMVNYSNMQAQEEVERIAETASKLISLEWPSEDSVGDPEEEFGQVLAIVGESMSGKVTMFVVDLEGRIILSSEDGAVGDSFVGKEIISEIRDTGEYDGRTDLDGALPAKKQVYGRPIHYKDKPVGILLAHFNGEEATGLFYSMNRAMFMSSLWVMLAALVIVYFVSDRLVRPIRGMSRAVKNFAKGNFEERVSVVGKDEIAELAIGFNQMADSLAQMEKMRNSFLANVAHDLRTPMTAIAGFIDGIKSGAIPPEKQEYYLNIISSEIHRLSRLVSQILDVSRLASGERKFSFVKCDICETARIVLISFEHKIDAKRLNVEFEAEEDSLFVMADADALHQIIYNLCENAIKFSREEGLLRISLRRTEKKKISIEIFNEGVGIAKEDLPYVFDRFYKSDKSRGLDKNGVGLGLFIVKSIVDAHEGFIAVESEEGKNCAFRVVFSEVE